MCPTFACKFTVCRRLNKYLQFARNVIIITLPFYEVLKIAREALSLTCYLKARSSSRSGWALRGAMRLPRSALRTPCSRSVTHKPFFQLYHLIKRYAGIRQVQTFKCFVHTVQRAPVSETEYRPCCQNSGTSIGLIGRRLSGNYLLASMEAIPTFECGKRAAGRLPFIELQK